MADFWNKVKQTLEQSAGSIKKSADSITKAVSEKTPEIASTIADKSKNFASAVSDKSQELFTLGQLKLRQYNLNKDVSDLFTKVGEATYALNGNGVYNDKTIQELLSDIKNLEQKISDTEQEMENSAPKLKSENEPQF